MEIKVLRILKPDGHLLWTMKASQEDKSTEFGLFEQNLQVWLSLWEMGLSIESLQDFKCLNTGFEVLKKNLMQK